MITADRLNTVEEYYFSKKLREVNALKEAGAPIINLGISSIPIVNSTVNLIAVERVLTGEDASSLWTFGKIDKDDITAVEPFDQYTLTVNQSIYHRPLEGSNTFKFTFETSAQANVNPSQAASGTTTSTLFLEIANVAPTINLSLIHI